MASGLVVSAAKTKRDLVSFKNPKAKRLKITTPRRIIRALLIFNLFFKNLKICIIILNYGTSGFAVTTLEYPLSDKPSILTDLTAK